MYNKLFKLNFQDLIRGLITSVFGSVLDLLYQMLKQHEVIDLEELGQVAAIALVGYLLKNVFTDKNGKFIGKFKIK